jgi:hypothetical protein
MIVNLRFFMPIWGFDAERFSELFGDSLIGQKIESEFAGVVKVVELHPDPVSPEIVILAMHPTHGELRVLAWDRVRFP